MRKTNPPKWFQEWEGNEFDHLKLNVRINTRLLWIIIGALVAAALIDRFFG